MAGARVCTDESKSLSIRVQGIVDARCIRVVDLCKWDGCRWERGTETLQNMQIDADGVRWQGGKASTSSRRSMRRSYRVTVDGSLVTRVSWTLTLAERGAQAADGRVNGTGCRL
jgi:hypothetical protein